MFGFMYCPVQVSINVPVPCIKTVVPGHFEILFWDVLYEEFDEINGGKRPPHKRIVLMPVVMESDCVAVIGINPGKGNGRTSEVAADVPDDGIGVAEAWLGIDVKAIFIIFVYFGLGLFERRAKALLKPVQ